MLGPNQISQLSYKIHANGNANIIPSYAQVFYYAFSPSNRRPIISPSVVPIYFSIFTILFLKRHYYPFPHFNLLDMSFSLLFFKKI